MDEPDILPPGLAEIEAMARRALAALPPEIRAQCGDVALRIEDFAEREILDGLGIEDPFELTGLYDGVALTEKSVADQRDGPDQVFLYRRPILEEWIERGDVGLEELVSHVLVHEIAHHFGWSDERIMEIDDWTR